MKKYKYKCRMAIEYFYIRVYHESKNRGFLQVSNIIEKIVLERLTRRKENAAREMTVIRIEKKPGDKEKERQNAKHVRKSRIS